jgi:hypothetical protein
MQIEIKYDEYNSPYTQCPICSTKVDVIFDDYVEKHPMIWCWECGGGNTKYVIDCSIEDISMDELSKVVDLLLITRIVNTEDMVTFIANFNKKNNTSFEELSEIRDYMKINDNDISKKILDEVGVELNSYNIADIRKKYPEYYLAHDGVYIWIEVLEKDGSLTVMKFWGD